MFSREFFEISKNIFLHRTIRVPKVAFCVFEKLKNEIQKLMIRFCSYLSMKTEIQIVDYYFHVKIDFYFEFLIHFSLFIRFSFS